MDEISNYMYSSHACFVTLERSPEALSKKDNNFTFFGITAGYEF
jgi:hypothetical protein